MTSSPDATSAWNVPELDAVIGRPVRPEMSVAPASWVPTDLDRALRAAKPPTALEQAYASGLEEGSGRGAERARHELAPALAMLGRLMTELNDVAEAFARDSERNLEGLALAVARRLVMRELTADPMYVRELIVKALELMPLDSEIVVRMNPADFEALGDSLASVAPAGRVTLRWAPDPALERGSFVAESPQRMVDGRTDVSLRDLYERLGDG